MIPMKSVKPVLYGLGCAFMLYTLTGFFLVPYLGKQLLIRKAAPLVQRSMEIGELGFNPFTLSASLKSLKILDRDNTDLFELDALVLDLSAASFFRLALVVDRLALSGPRLWLKQDANGTLNISDILTSGATKEDTKTAETHTGNPIPGFSLSRVTLEDGALYLTDARVNTTHTVASLGVNLPFISSLEKDRNTDVSADLHLVLNSQAIDLRVAGRPFGRPGPVTAHLTTDNMDLTPYLAYLDLPVDIQVASPGRLSLDLTAGITETFNTSGLPGLSLKGTMGLAGIDIRHQDSGPLLSWDEIKLGIDSPDLNDKTIRLTRLALTRPAIHLTRKPDGSLDLAGIISDKPATKGSDESGQAVEADQTSKIPEFRFILDDAVLDQGRLVFSDLSVPGRFSTTLSPIQVRLEKLSFDQSLSLGFDLTIETEAKERLALNGILGKGPDPQLDGTLTLDQILAGRYTPYLSAILPMEHLRGTVSAQTRFNLPLNQETPKGLISQGRIRIRQLEMGKGETPAVAIPEFELSGIQADLDQKKLVIGRAETREGRILIQRDNQGHLNLLPNPGNAAPAQSAPVPQASANRPATPDESDWQARVDQVSVAGYDLAFEDLVPGTPAKVGFSDINIQVSHLSSEKGVKAQAAVHMKGRHTGRFSAEGSVDPMDLAADIRLDIDDLDIRFLAPYLAPYLNISINQGLFKTQGRLRMAKAASGKPAIHYTGQAGLGDFVSTYQGADLLTFKSLFLTEMALASDPPGVHIKETALTDFYARAVIDNAGRFNLGNLLAKPVGQSVGPDRPGQDALPAQTDVKQPIAAKKEDGASLPDIDLDTITLQGGQIHFSDFFTQPNFTSHMSEIGGVITGLSTRSGKPAQVRLQGTHGTDAPLVISGQIAPLSGERLIDLGISFKNIQLPGFNPYAAKYLGYEIEKGKLVMDLKYHIRGNTLSSENHLFFDQLTLGNSVKSDTAVSLPLPLAISLLKNADGQINLDLPVTGALDDPKFDFGKVISSTLKNLILGVVQAPFKFLGSILGRSGEELGFSRFALGSSSLDPADQEKLDQLAGVLAEKPGLRLEIQGQYDPVQDREALQKTGYEQLLISMDPDLPKQEIQVDTLDPGRYATLVEAAYFAAKFPKPREADGKEKQISLTEKEKLLRTSIPVQPAELTALARARAEQVKAYLNGTGKIQPERIFLLSPAPVPAKEEKQKRVKTIFRLKG